MNRFAMAALGLLLAAALTSCDRAPTGDSHAEGQQQHGEEGHDEPRGPHRGRLLESGDLQLEVSIFEDGVPPEFRLYVTSGGAPVPPDQLRAAIDLHRVTGIEGGVTDRHAFTPREDHLVSAREVYEPHSFDVSVQLEYKGKTYDWKYASPEGRVEMDPAVATAAGIVTAKAGPGAISDQLLLYGRIAPDAERMRQVRARFPGPVRSVAVRTGDSVQAGQVLATVESNESLQTYSVTAPISGQITARHVNAGENAGEGALFEIADFSSVWAEVSVFQRDRARLSVGQSVDVRSAEGDQRGAGTIRLVSPSAAGVGPATVIARVVLDNARGKWTPGQFIEAQVAVATHASPMVVPLQALQRFRDWDVVFVNEGATYQALPVQLGRRDGTHVEILAGVRAGVRIVTGNSYLVKADIEKSGASHDH
jgi:cobalt-zinc-cadmium efflux system membrane fusion protein